jgi:hypothetical protein
MLILIVTLLRQKKLQILIAVVSVGFSFYALQYHYPIQKDLSADAQDYIKAADYIEPNSIVLPLNYSGNWLHSNLSCYLGACNSSLTLDNYEVNQGHFPLLWKIGMNPEKYIGDFPASILPCVNLTATIPTLNRKVDYVLLFKKPHDLKDSCSINVMKQLELYFKQIDFPSNSLSIYKNKSIN